MYSTEQLEVGRIRLIRMKHAYHCFRWYIAHPVRTVRLYTNHAK